MSKHMMDVLIPIVECEVRSGRKETVQVVVETIEYVMALVIAYDVGVGKRMQPDFDPEDSYAKSRALIEMIVSDHFPRVLNAMRPEIEAAIGRTDGEQQMTMFSFDSRR